MLMTCLCLGKGCITLGHDGSSRRRRHCGHYKLPFGVIGAGKESTLMGRETSPHRAEANHWRRRPLPHLVILRGPRLAGSSRMQDISRCFVSTVNVRLKSFPPNMYSTSSGLRSNLSVLCFPLSNIHRLGCNTVVLSFALLQLFFSLLRCEKKQDPPDSNNSHLYMLGCE